MSAKSGGSVRLAGKASIDLELKLLVLASVLCVASILGGFVLFKYFCWIYFIFINMRVLNLFNYIKRKAKLQDSGDVVQLYGNTFYLL